MKDMVNEGGLFGVFLIGCCITAFIIFIGIMPPNPDPITWLIVGSSLGTVLAIGIIFVAEGRKQ